VELGYNYRLTDMQCALGRSQLKRLPVWLDRRRAIAKAYDSAFRGMDCIEPLANDANVENAYHLYVVRIQGRGKSRDQVFNELRAQGIGVNVHYIPVHLQPFYVENYHTGLGQCPVAEEAYQHIISLPIFGAMRDDEVSTVITAVSKTLH
jgi:perosamine synthetase